MATKPQKGAEEARNQLPDLLDAAERGRSTVITRHGRPVAEIIPVGESRPPAGQSLLSLAGSGRGLWGKHLGAAVRRLREEWSR